MNGADLKMETPDAKTIEQINRTAESLMIKHMASSMEDAIEMAKEIVLKKDDVPAGVGISLSESSEVEANLEAVKELIGREIRKAVVEVRSDRTLDEIEKRLDEIAEGEEKSALPDASRSSGGKEKLSAEQVASIIMANPKAVELIKNDPSGFIERMHRSETLVKLFRDIDVNEVMRIITKITAPSLSLS